MKIHWPRDELDWASEFQNSRRDNRSHWTEGANFKCRNLGGSGSRWWFGSSIRLHTRNPHSASNFSLSLSLLSVWFKCIRNQEPGRSKSLFFPVWLSFGWNSFESMAGKYSRRRRISNQVVPEARNTLYTQTCSSFWLMEESSLRQTRPPSSHTSVRHYHPPPLPPETTFSSHGCLGN
jgi:hypothetical protein